MKTIDKLRQIYQLRMEVDEFVTGIYKKYIKDNLISYTDEVPYGWTVGQQFVEFYGECDWEDEKWTLSIELKFFEDYDAAMKPILEERAQSLRTFEAERKRQFEKHEKSEYRRLKKKFGMVAL